MKKGPTINFGPTRAYFFIVFTSQVGTLIRPRAKVTGLVYWGLTPQQHVQLNVDRIHTLPRKNWLSYFKFDSSNSNSERVIHQSVPQSPERKKEETYISTMELRNYNRVTKN